MIWYCPCIYVLPILRAAYGSDLVIMLGRSEHHVFDPRDSEILELTKANQQHMERANRLAEALENAGALLLE